MTWDANARSYLQTHKNRHYEHLIWARVKRLDNGNPVEFGFWTGALDETFTVDGSVRAYFGGQGGIKPGAPTYDKGLDVFRHRTQMSITPEAEEMIRDYRIADAPFEYHVALFNPANMGFIGINRRFQGVLSTAKIDKGAIGGTSSIQIQAMTKAIEGLKLMPDGKSDADQRRRNAADGMLKDASMGTVVSDPWQAKA